MTSLQNLFILILSHRNHVNLQELPSGNTDYSIEFEVSDYLFLPRVASKWRQVKARNRKSVKQSQLIYIVHLKTDGWWRLVKTSWKIFYSSTFIFMLSYDKVWKKWLISGVSQARTAGLRKCKRYDPRHFGAGGWAVHFLVAPLKTELEWIIFAPNQNLSSAIT